MIHGFYGDGERRLGSLLRTFLDDLPILPATDLCRAMADATSDKALGRHNYTLLYERLFSPLRGRAERVFEVGIGSKGAFPCAMTGAHYKVGASLRGWRAWFQNARIVGADIDADALFAEDRITTYQVDQTQPESIARLWTQVSASHPGLFDAMIDDGWHHHPANECFLLNSIHMLAPHGLYIVEDIVTRPDNIARFDATLRAMGRPAALVTIPHRPDPGDNTVAIICGV